MNQTLSVRILTLFILTLSLPIAALEAAPIVTKILNNSSLIPPGLPNYGIAPSSIFIVQGTGLADAGSPRSSARRR